MELTFEYWYMFPIAILVATIAMATGVGGAVFYSPLFMLVLKLEPTVAIGTALTTQLFGVSSGCYAYSKAGLIDYKLGFSLLKFSIPFAILGTFAGRYVPPDFLKGVFAIGIIFIGSRLYESWKTEKQIHRDTQQKNTSLEYEYLLTDNQGRKFQYNIKNKLLGRFFAGLGGMLLGMISVGLSELQEYHLVVRSKVPLPVAVATAIFIAVVTVLVASTVHFYEFVFHSSKETLKSVLNIIVFSIPGVIIGGQIGPRIQSKIPSDKMKIFIAVLFTIVGLLLVTSLLV